MKVKDEPVMSPLLHFVANQNVIFKIQRQPSEDFQEK